MNTTTGQVLLLSPQRFPLDLIPLSNWNLDVGEGHYSHLHFCMSTSGVFLFLFRFVTTLFNPGLPLSTRQVLLSKRYRNIVKYWEKKRIIMRNASTRDALGHFACLALVLTSVGACIFWTVDILLIRFLFLERFSFFQALPKCSS